MGLAELIEPHREEKISPEEELHRYWGNLTKQPNHPEHLNNLQNFSKVSIGSVIRALIHLAQFKKAVSNEDELRKLTRQVSMLSTKISLYVRVSKDKYIYEERIYLLNLEQLINTVLKVLSHPDNQAAILDRITKNPIPGVGDKAQISTPVDYISSDKASYGGIDLNADMLNLKLNGDMKEMNLSSVDQAALNQPIDGVIPIIFRIIPANLSSLIEQ